MSQNIRKEGGAVIKTEERKTSGDKEHLCTEFLVK